MKTLKKFDDYFKVRKNTIYERARFNRRDQREEELSEQYITTLYDLVESCEYGPLKEENVARQISRRHQRCRPLRETADGCRTDAGKSKNRH